MELLPRLFGDFIDFNILKYNEIETIFEAFQLIILYKKTEYIMGIHNDRFISIKTKMVPLNSIEFIISDGKSYRKRIFSREELYLINKEIFNLVKPQKTVTF